MAILRLLLQWLSGLARLQGVALPRPSKNPRIFRTPNGPSGLVFREEPDKQKLGSRFSRIYKSGSRSRIYRARLPSSIDSGSRTYNFVDWRSRT